MIASLRGLLQAPRWTRERLLAYQSARLRALVRHAWVRVPFYHKSLWAAEPKRDAWHHAEIRVYAAPAAHTHAALRGQLVFVNGVPAPLGDLLPPEGVA